MQHLWFWWIEPKEKNNREICAQVPRLQARTKDFLVLLYNKYAVSVASVRGVRESEHFGAATAAEGVASLLT